MFRVALTLHESGYRYMLMPDHMPRHPGRPRRKPGVRLRLRVYQSHGAGGGRTMWPSAHFLDKGVAFIGDLEFSGLTNTII